MQTNLQGQNNLSGGTPLVLQTGTQAAAALAQTASGALAAAKAQSMLAAAAISVKKALKNMVAGFDELHIALQDTQTPGKTTKPNKGSGGKGSGGKKPAGKDKEPEPQEDQAQQSAFEAWIERLRAYIAENLAPATQAWSEAFLQLRTAAGEAFASVSESAGALWHNALAPMGEYLTGGFLPAVLNSVSEAVAPILADVGTTMMEVFAGGFATACRIAQDAINTILAPALQLVQKVFTDMCAAVQGVWAEHGAPLMEGVKTAFEGLFSLLEGLYTTVIQPVLSGLIAMLSVLWSEHLAPLWENLLQLFAAVGEMLLALWNNVLQPMVDFLITTFGPVFAAICSGIGEVFGTVAGVISDVISGILTALHGLCEFLTGTFTGSWTRAWNGIRDIFGGIWDSIVSILKGAVNAMITCVNAVVNAVAAAVNGIVGAINSINFTVPKWVPGFGGNSIGFHLQGVNAPQVPMLARGAVIPPNAAFLAVLGEQKSGRNLEAPEALIRQIIREESGGASRFTAEQPVELSLDGDIFYRAMMRIRAQRGAPIGGVFADVI